MIVIGVDCATDPKNIGLAVGEFSTSTPRRLLAVDRLGSHSTVLEKVMSWMPLGDACLLALDAPLGWPAPLGSNLNKHTAGQPIAVPANQMFRRETDRVIKQKLDRQPLDVGADHIARTAHAAVQFLGELRAATELPIPLAWEPMVTDPSVIEVYPTVTLSAHGLRSKQYKKTGRESQRAEIAKDLTSRMLFDADVCTQLVSSDHVLDAAICVLAGFDFLDGSCFAPEDHALAVKEGWIWARPRVA